jgi:peptidylprolyl isomerase
MDRQYNTKRQARKTARARAKLLRRALTIGLLVVAAVAIPWLIWTSLHSNQAAAQMPELVGTKQYSSAPPMLIDVSKQYFATVVMAKGGQFVIQLYPDKAPITVNSFVFLAREGFFDGLTFHRVIEGFMAQGGDPAGTGGGGPGYEFVNEVSDLKFDKPGVVAMANKGLDTNGSQFFIMFNAYDLSPSKYTIFGQVIEGMDVVDAITRRDPSTADFPGDAMQSVTITEGTP